MHIRTGCITAASVLALAAPAAALARETAVHTTHHKSTHVVYTAPFGSVPIRTPNYVYIPGMSPGAAAPAPVSTDCSADINACTDPVELCQIWGQC
jgi:hypothetical protein